jgi:hypothetical protein
MIARIARAANTGIDGASQPEALAQLSKNSWLGVRNSRRGNPGAVARHWARGSRLTPAVARIKLTS